MRQILKSNNFKNNYKNNLKIIFIIRIMNQTNKFINIYDKENHPLEKCNNIKNEWNTCCNKYLKNNSRELCSEKTQQCLILFNNYIKCFSENLSGTIVK